MKNCILSVVIPAFNVEKYIERAVSSVKKQSYDDIEIIIVNDGSTDKTGQIINRIACEDKRINVFHIKRTGSISARRYGLKNATGEYVTFVDSDDWIESDMYRKMLDKAFSLDVDLVTSGLCYDYLDGKQNFEKDLFEEGLYLKKETQKNIVTKMMYDFNYSRRGITSSVVNKLFRKVLLENIMDEIDTEITYGEDAAITYPFIMKAEKIFIFKDCWYHYCIRNNSLVNDFSIDTFSKIKIFYEFMRAYFERNKSYDCMKLQLEYYVRDLLSFAEYKLLNIPVENMKFIFPYECVNKGCKVILYGAGCVGISYYRSILAGNYVDIIAWVDKQYKKMQKAGFPVEDIHCINELNYDYIVIAIDNKKIAYEIKENLVQNMKVKEKCIIWKINKWK